MLYSSCRLLSSEEAVSSRLATFGRTHLEIRLPLGDFIQSGCIGIESGAQSGQLFLLAEALSSLDFLLRVDPVDSGEDSLQVFLAARMLILQVGKCPGAIEQESSCLFDFRLGGALGFLEHFAARLLALKNLLLARDFQRQCCGGLSQAFLLALDQLLALRDGRQLPVEII